MAARMPLKDPYIKRQNEEAAKAAAPAPYTPPPPKIMTIEEQWPTLSANSVNNNKSVPAATASLMDADKSEAAKQSLIPQTPVVSDSPIAPAPATPAQAYSATSTTSISGSSGGGSGGDLVVSKKRINSRKATNLNNTSDLMGGSSIAYKTLLGG